MAYLLRQKFNINELVSLSNRAKKVLLAMSEENLREIYERHLKIHGFKTIGCHFANHAQVALALPDCDLLVIDFNAAQESQDKMEFLKIINRNFPKIPVVTVGNALGNVLLEKLMALGIVGHLDRRLTRPADLAAIIKTFMSQ